jgi:hypothetical protein
MVISISLSLSTSHEKMYAVCALNSDIVVIGVWTDDLAYGVYGAVEVGIAENSAVEVGAATTILPKPKSVTCEYFC